MFKKTSIGFLLMFGAVICLMAQETPPAPAPELAPVAGPPAGNEAPFVEITPESITAVEKGLNFIAERQNKKTGSISGNSYPVATTALAGLAFLANGSTPSQGKYNENIRKCIDYLVSCANRKGFITESSNSSSRMHGHAYATLFLAEVSGMVDDSMKVDVSKLYSVINKAIKIIESSQTKLGGWGYEPLENTYDEGSVTICQVQALRSCKNAGFKVDKKVIDKALEYVKKSANPNGSFKYSLSSGGGGGSGTLTAAAVSTLNYLGVYDAETPELKKGLQYLQQNYMPEGGRDEGYFFYGKFYATLAMYYSGDEYWQKWFPKMREALLKRQRKINENTACWENEISQEFCTSLACLMLQIPYQYLPIFQR